MARSNCTSCGLRSQRCQCRREASTAGNANGDEGEIAFKLTGASFCVIFLATALAFTGFYLLFVFSLGGFSSSDQESCHLEVLVDSFSLSNASTATATADWNVTFVAKSPGNGCQVSLHMIKSRLLRGGKLVSESFVPDYFGSLVDGRINEPLSYAVFKNVPTPQDIGGGGGVVWDLRVSVVSSFNINDPSLKSSDESFLNVDCAGIPVSFTVDPTGNVKGSLLGYKRPCEYFLRENYTDTSF